MENQLAKRCDEKGDYVEGIIHRCEAEELKSRKESNG